MVIFFCDCPVGMKGKLGKHTVGMLYKEGRLELTSDIRAVPLGQKRRKGRPKKLPHCLSSSPTPPSQKDSSVMETEDVEPVEAPLQKTSRKKRKAVLIDPEPVEEPVQSPVHVLHSQSRAQAGLGCHKPPKKRLRLTTG